MLRYIRPKLRHIRPKLRYIRPKLRYIRPKLRYIGPKLTYPVDAHKAHVGYTRTSSDAARMLT